MNKGGGGGIGVGSASIVLVFSVLCLSIFSLITYKVAGNGKALVMAEQRLVSGYYEADALAARVMSKIISSESISRINEDGFISDNFHGVDVECYWDGDNDSYVAEYFCSVAQSDKSLYVRLALYMDSYEVLAWRMWDPDEWAPDSGYDLFIPDEMDVWFGLDNEYEG